MLRSQRILLVACLLLCAGVLHINLCEWLFGEQLHMWQTVPTPEMSAVQQHHLIWARQHREPSGGIVYTGLVTDQHVSPAAAVSLGIVMPLLMVAGAAYLILGWRQAVRTARGLCPTCGYPIGKSDVCTECGTNVKRQIPAS